MIATFAAKKYDVTMGSNTSLSTYTDMPMVPAGAILDRIIKQQKRVKSEVAAASQLIPQRLNDLIMGNRRFTPKSSMALEAALGIETPGFFYLIQANHDIYEAQRAAGHQQTPRLDILTKTTFWDTNLEKVDWARCKRWAIRRVLEYGTAEEIREIDRFYGHDALMEVFNHPEGFRLYDQVKSNLQEAGI